MRKAECKCKGNFNNKDNNKQGKCLRWSRKDKWLYNRKKEKLLQT